MKPDVEVAEAAVSPLDRLKRVVYEIDRIEAELQALRVANACIGKGEMSWRGNGGIVLAESTLRNLVALGIATKMEQLEKQLADYMKGIPQ